MHLLNLRLARSTYFQTVLIIIIIIKFNEFIVRVRALITGTQVEVSCR
jgi:hypothetical protein